MTTCQALKISDKRADEIIEEMKKRYAQDRKKGEKKGKYNFALTFRDLNKKYELRNEAIFAIYSFTRIVDIRQPQAASVDNIMADLFANVLRKAK
jgi:hypothetical protein